MNLKMTLQGSSDISLIPNHLSGQKATGVETGHPLAQFEIGRFQNFVYLILDWETRKASIVDPQEDVSIPLKAINENQFELVSVFITHSHFDHVAGVEELTKRFPKLPIYIHPKEAFRLNNLILRHPEQFKWIKDEEIILVGNLRLTAFHTPGHSAGECSFFLQGAPPFLLTGDTIFIRDCGRTDLPTGSNDEMFASLQRIKKLPKNTVFLPGHHYKRECATTLEQELLQSLPFQCKTVEELAALP